MKKAKKPTRKPAVRKMSCGGAVKHMSYGGPVKKMKYGGKAGGCRVRNA
jgi:hypothetical protein